MSFIKNKKILFIFILFISVFVIFFFSLKREVKHNPTIMIGKDFPEFNAKTLNNKNSSSFYPKNIKQKFIINIFASWCAPCWTEHEFLINLSKKNIKIIGINYKDNETNVLKYLKKLGNPYAEIYVDDLGQISILAGAYGVPETFLINEDGKIIFKHVGPIDDKIYQWLLKNIL